MIKPILSIQNQLIMGAPKVKPNLHLFSAYFNKLSKIELWEVIDNMKTLMSGSSLEIGKFGLKFVKQQFWPVFY